MALKHLTKLAAKSKAAKAGIVASKTKAGVATAKLGTTAIATSSTAKAGLIAGATVAATSTLETETLKNGTLAKTTETSIETSGYNDIVDNIASIYSDIVDNIASTYNSIAPTLGTETSDDGVLAKIISTLPSIDTLVGIIPNVDLHFNLNVDLNVVLSIGATLFVIFIVRSLIFEHKQNKKRRAKILDDYYEATNTIAYQESLGINPEEKVKFIEIIRLYITEFMNKNFDIEKTAHFIGYIQRDCIKLSQAFLLIDRFMSESRQSVLALQSISNLNKLIIKLDAAEIKYKEGSLSDIDFQRKVENIV
jgi:hypothetical protein